MTTRKNEEVRTEPPQMSALPKLNSDLTWDQEIHGIKYRLHEASIPELAEAAGGARSEEEKQIRLLSLVVQEQDASGKWVPIVWPKGAQRLYLMLASIYGLGLGALEGEFTKKCPLTLTNTSKTENSSTTASESSQKP